jgi:hypothetical protein
MSFSGPLTSTASEICAAEGTNFQPNAALGLGALQARLYRLLFEFIFDHKEIQEISCPSADISCLTQSRRVVTSGTGTSRTVLQGPPR